MVSKIMVLSIHSIGSLLEFDEVGVELELDSSGTSTPYSQRAESFGVDEESSQPFQKNAAIASAIFFQCLYIIRL